MKKTKNRIISTILAVICLFNLLPVSAFATDGETGLTAKIASETATAGSTISIIVSVENNSGLSSFKGKLTYDDTLLTLESIEYNEAFGGQFMQPETTASPVLLTWLSPLENSYYSGTFATLNFSVMEIEEEQAVANLTMEFDPDDIYDMSEENIPLTVINGSVTIFNGLPGDINMDQKVNSKDATRLFQYLAGWNVEVDEAALDCNGDGKVNNKDATRLLQYVAGWNVKLYYGTKKQEKCTHIMEEHPATDATCLADGNTVYWHCTTCDTYYRDQNGSTVIKLEDIIVKAKGHTIVTDHAVPATSTTTGLTEGSHCSECDEVIVAQKVVAYEGNPTVILHFDNDLRKVLSKENKEELDNFTYQIDETKKLPVIELAGYTFVGWSDENGNICEYLEPGRTGTIHLYANLLSDRNRAWTAKTIGEPCIYEDDEQILFAYEIGKIENVPVYTIEDFGKVIANGVSENRTKEVSVQSSQSLVNAYSRAVEKATTGNATWTLSDGWTDSINISEEWAEENGMTVEEAETISKSENDNWYVNKTTGGASSETTIDSTDTYNLRTKTDNKKTYGSQDETSYDNTTTEKGWEIDLGLELGAKETLKTGKVVKLAADGGVELEQKFTVSGGWDGKVTDKTGADTVKKTGTDTDDGEETQTGTISNHTSNTVKSSNWSNESGFGGSTTNESSQAIAQVLSQVISNKTGYGKSYILSGNTSETQGLSTTNMNNDTFSSQVTYSTVTSETNIVSYSTAATISGYHRWVMATTAYVFGVVGYDKASESYFVTTYSILDDTLQKFQDYSYKNGTYSDCQSGIIDFCAPNEIEDYVKARMFGTDGLEYDKTGYVTQYTGTDSCVIIPEYTVIDNKDQTSTLIKVVGIKENVFRNNKQITGVVLSDFITEIPNNAFAGCSELWEIYGTGITKIGSNAFAGCEKLNSFTLSSDITDLGMGAFSSTDFLEVEATNAAVLEATLKSGAKNIVVDISNVQDGLNGKTLTIPDGTQSFTLRAYDGNYADLTIISYAETTKLNRINIASDSEIPLQLHSSEVVLNQVSVNTRGIAMVADRAEELAIYGANRFASDGINTLFVKNADISRVEGNLNTTVNVTGNIVTCNKEIKGIDLLNFTNGKLVTVSVAEFDNLLNSYVLTFDANGGSCATKSVEIANSTAIGTLPTPTRSYYTFDGWYLKDGTRVTEKTVFSSGEDQTVYAHWTVNSYTASWNNGTGYTITVNRTSSPNKGAATGKLNSGATVYYGDVLSITYTKADHYTIQSQGKTSVTVAGNVTASDIYATATLNAYTVSWNNGTGYTITVNRTSSPNKGAATGKLNSGAAVYYGDVLSITYSKADYYTIKTQGKTSITVAGNVTTSDIYATAELNPVSVASSAPAGAQILNTKWTYKKTSTTESTSSWLDGYSQTGSYWKQTGSGSTNYAYFPGGFDTSHWIYTSFAKEPYGAYDNGSTKRDVSNWWTGFVYYKWDYGRNGPGYANTTQRQISPYYLDPGHSGLHFNVFLAHLSATDHPYLSNDYCNNYNLPSYNCSSEFNTKETAGTSPRFHRFDYYTSYYTDYLKIYQYKKVESLESTNEVYPSSTISDVQKLVTYRAR